MSHDTPRIKATPREHTGSRFARRIRRQGQLPVVIYGHGEAPIHISIDTEAILPHLHHGTHVLDLEVDGQPKQTCLVRDVQYDHLGTNIIHLDLTRISMTDTVGVNVPLELRGQDNSPGYKDPDAVLEQPLVDMHVNCRADRIPDSILVDISRMDVGDSLLIRDMTLPEGVTADTHYHNEDDVVVFIHVSRAAAAEDELEAEGAEAASAEPEVITERKDEEAESSD